MTPTEFEYAIAEIFRRKGFQVHVTKQSSDNGIDIEMRKDGQRYVVQCKRYQGTVGEPIVRDFYGAFAGFATHGYLVTSGVFSQRAIEWAKKRPVTLVCGRELSKWYSACHPIAGQDNGPRLSRGTITSPFATKPNASRRDSTLARCWRIATHSFAPKLDASRVQVPRAVTPATFYTYKLWEIGMMVGLFTLSLLPVGSIMALCYLIAMGYASARDWRGFASVRGLIDWKNVSERGRVWGIIGMICFFPLVYIAYLFRAVNDSLKSHWQEKAEHPHMITIMSQAWHHATHRWRLSAHRVSHSMRLRPRRSTWRWFADRPQAPAGPARDRSL